MGGQGELRIMNIEVYFLVRNSEFNIRYSIFNAYVFPGAMNRAPTILYDESRPTDTDHRHRNVLPLRLVPLIHLIAAAIFSAVFPMASISPCFISQMLMGSSGLPLTRGMRWR
jgi:hypothetical protein